MKTTAKNNEIKRGKINLSKIYRAMRNSNIQGLLYLPILTSFLIYANPAYAGGFNGSGTYNRFYNWTNDAANGVNITASRFDTEDNGFATGLSTTITKDGQQTCTARIPFAVGLSFAAASGMAPTGDLTTGIFQLQGAGTLGIKSAGTQVAEFDNNGLDNTAVGIGTAAAGAFTTLSASSTLAVTGTSNLTGNVTLGGTINKLTLTQPASSATFTLANGKTFAVNNTLTLAGTDSTTMTFPSSSDTVVTLGATQTLTNKTLTTAALGSSTATTQAANTSNTTLATTKFANPASSVASPGYQQLPSGVYLEWGSTSTVNSGSNTTVTLPIAFPNNQWGCTCTVNNNTSCYYNNISASQAEFFNNGANSANIYWFCWGN